MNPSATWRAAPKWWSNASPATTSSKAAGPSGCGKTTTLRLIAGFVEASAGEIRVGDQLISSPARTLPPERRNMSMIFQSYALWPHMTVAQNVSYGLKLRKLDRATIDRKLAPIPDTTHP